MVKEIRTFVYCDGPAHDAEDQVEAEVTHRVKISNDKEREIDLCGPCEKALISPLVDLLRDVGQPVPKGTSAKSASPVPGQPPLERQILLTCPEDCGRADIRGVVGLVQHLKRTHGVESAEASRIARQVRQEVGDDLLI